MPLTKALLLSIAAVAGVSYASAQSPDGAAPAAPETAIARGHRLYIAQGCYQCHGYVGQGSVATGPALVPAPADAEAFTRYLRAPRGSMPAYSVKHMPQADVDDTLAYIRTFSVGRPANSIPLLAPLLVQRTQSAAPTKARPASLSSAPPRPTKASASKPAIGAGQKLYGTYCSACHGANLEGGGAPSLRGESAKRDLNGTVRLLINPPVGMPKLSPAPLSEQQMREIAVYIRSPR